MVKDFLQQHSTIVLVVILTIIALVGFITFDAVSKQDTRSLPLTTVPSDATVKINNNVTKLGSTTTLPFGTHDITVSKEGFAERSIQITVTKDGEYENIETITLAPVSTEALMWFEDNRELYGDFADLKTNVDPIFAYIPYESLVFTVSSSSTSAPVMVDAASLGIYKNAPIDYLKRSGLKPSDYSYSINNISPFGLPENE